jgi:hypothetical protein
MQKAYENIYVISICTIDENLPRVLTHMLEQLESCQKSLSGSVLVSLFLFRFYLYFDLDI